MVITRSIPERDEIVVGFEDGTEMTLALPPRLKQPDPEIRVVDAYGYDEAAFLRSLAAHVDEPFEEVQAVYQGLSWNLRHLVNQPQGWVILSRTLCASPKTMAPFIPTIN